MAGLASGTRPQTLRQAKRAYRKSSAKPKLSASEIAMAERRAVLQERADRIKEREARRKANLKKREERKEAERERLLKAGKDVLPPTRGFKVGPSQLDLARFLPGVAKGGEKEEHGGREHRKDSDPASQVDNENESESFNWFKDQDRSDDEENNRSSSQGKKSSNKIEPADSTPSRSPLKERCTNSVKRRRVEEESKEKRSFTRHDEAVQQQEVEWRNAQNADQKVQGMASSLPKSPSREQCTGFMKRHEFEAGKALKAMPPPPLPPPPPLVAIASFDEFFPSNTQIERELSPPPRKQQTTFVEKGKPRTKPLPFQPPPPPSDPYDLLASISTQDLDFSGTFTQVAPTTKIESPFEHPSTPAILHRPPFQETKPPSFLSKPANSRRENEPCKDHEHQPPSTTPLHDSTIAEEDDFLANISTQDLFSSQTTIPNSPLPSPASKSPPPPPPPPPPSKPQHHQPSQCPAYLPPPPPRQKILPRPAAGASTSFDLDDDDDGFTADDLAIIAVQVEMASSGSSAATALPARSPDG